MTVEEYIHLFLFYNLTCFNCIVPVRFLMKHSVYHVCAGTYRTQNRGSVGESPVAESLSCVCCLCSAANCHCLTGTLYHARNFDFGTHLG